MGDTIFIQTVASLKLGVAFPIANPSFEHYSDAARTADPVGWTKEGGIVAARNENVSGVALAADVADEGSSIVLSGSSIPNNDTMRLISTVKQYWHTNGPQLPASLKVYATGYFRVSSITTPGGSVQFRFGMHTDDNSAMSSGANGNLHAAVATQPSLARVSSLTVTSSAAGDRYARFWLRLRDAAAMTVVCDEIGAMFDPFANNGYTAFSNVFPVNGPEFEGFGHTSGGRNQYGTRRRYDVSGGARNYRIALEFSGEQAAAYEALRRYERLNSGSDGRPPLPLGLELNVPGVPPLLMVDIVNFGLRRQIRRAELYAGVVEFETVWR